MTKIKACPFCGKQPIIKQGDMIYGYHQFYACCSCGIRTSFDYNTEKDAIFEWNSKHLICVKSKTFGEILNVYKEHKQ